MKITQFLEQKQFRNSTKGYNSPKNNKQIILVYKTCPLLDGNKHPYQA